MSSQRYSCDRCRHHKVRCLKLNGDSTTTGTDRSSGDTCERCAKAEVPCVYSSRQKKGRASSHRLRRDSTLMSFTRTMPFSQDMTGIWSAGSDVGDMSVPFFDTAGMDMDFGDGDFYNWENSQPTPGPTSAALLDSSGSSYFAAQRDPGDRSLTAKETDSTVEGLIGQVMDVSTRAARATRQLESGTSVPLMVSSPEINEAFETANALVQIVSNIPQNSKSSSPPLLTRSDDQHSTTSYGLIFLALASHQHVLALFKAICGSIERSVGFHVSANEQQDQPAALHGDGASCAQFVMVLQLIMHLVNRLGRCLRLDSPECPAISKPHGCLNGTAELTPSVDGEKEKGIPSAGFVELAQDMLQKLPDEHVKLRETIKELQTHMEERLHT